MTKDTTSCAYLNKVNSPIILLLLWLLLPVRGSEDSGKESAEGAAPSIENKKDYVISGSIKEVSQGENFDWSKFEVSSKNLSTMDEENRVKPAPTGSFTFPNVPAGEYLVQ
ncbi:MAG: hypothetical protein MUO31_08070, partial [Thermodesulfovibrionales bacterium]|nr:hypothetical protein [Thermodesulfovibrionales bacterium]